MSNPNRTCASFGHPYIDNQSLDPNIYPFGSLPNLYEGQTTNTNMQMLDQQPPLSFIIGSNTQPTVNQLNVNQQNVNVQPLPLGTQPPISTSDQHFQPLPHPPPQQILVQQGGMLPYSNNNSGSMAFVHVPQMYGISSCRDVPPPAQMYPQNPSLGSCSYPPQPIPLQNCPPNFQPGYPPTFVSSTVPPPPIYCQQTSPTSSSSSACSSPSSSPSPLASSSLSHTSAIGGLEAYDLSRWPWPELNLGKRLGPLHVSCLKERRKQLNQAGTITVSCDQFPKYRLSCVFMTDPSEFWGQDVLGNTPFFFITPDPQISSPKKLIVWDNHGAQKTEQTKKHHLRREYFYHGEFWGKQVISLTDVESSSLNVSLGCIEPQSRAKKRSGGSLSPQSIVPPPQSLMRFSGLYDPKVFGPGKVVCYTQNTVSLDTSSGGSVSVISNHTGSELEIAQQATVHVYVHGSVNKNQKLRPSGMNDGYAVAVDPQHESSTQQIFGWCTEPITGRPDQVECSINIPTCSSIIPLKTECPSSPPSKTESFSNSNSNPHPNSAASEYPHSVCGLCHFTGNKQALLAHYKQQSHIDRVRAFLPSDWRTIVPRTPAMRDLIVRIIEQVPYLSANELVAIFPEPIFQKCDVQFIFYHCDSTLTSDKGTPPRWWKST
ncbi:hypothetical protein Pelo_10402 [Pelomyxa schiedti]|nr:hypothetical protein Pelo_10402 [Pelomyxa schiedti]